MAACKCGCRMLKSIYVIFKIRNSVPACSTALVLLLGMCAAAYGADPVMLASGLEKRYASVETAGGSFRQTYRAPGMEQEESGSFVLKKPGFMRWEYRVPEEKLFIADGRECFLYVPQDHQVTVYPLTASDVRSTPLAFLLGGGNITKNFSISSESEYKPAFDHTSLIRLKPLKQEEEYSFLVLELDASSFDIRRVVVREHTGNTSEFFLANVTMNIKVNSRDFQFKPPKGVEVVRLNK
jgi:outer membrane lipoprotein carrier protein